ATVPRRTSTARQGTTVGSVTPTGEPSVRIATSDDVHPLHLLRRDVEEWLADSGIRQWPRGMLTTTDIATQVHRGEWHLSRRDDGAIAAAMRVLWTDPAVWGTDDTRAVYVHGLMVDRSCAGLDLGTTMLNAAEQY